MIIDDSVSFFGVYYHNCVFNLGLSNNFKSFYSKSKYKNVILCQRDEKKGYLLTQSIGSDTNQTPYMQSYYFSNKKLLMDGFKKLTSKIDSSDKIFYLIRSTTSSDPSDVESLIKKWKNEVKNSCKDSKS